MAEIPGVFVTGTDTGVGKTVASVLLIQALRARGFRCGAMKPVASGCELSTDGLRNDDALAVMQAAGVDVPYDQVNPYAFAPAIAPHLAAAEADTPITLDRIVDTYGRFQGRVDWMVVEGAGGWRVPLSESLEMGDLARALGLPVVLVVGMRLGCLNHALLTAESILAAGVPLVGWVANFFEREFERSDENTRALEVRMPVPCIARIPYCPGSRDHLLARTAVDLEALLTNAPSLRRSSSSVAPNESIE